METENTPYQVTYWVNRKDQIAVMRINDITVQGWKARGRDLTKDFDHGHFQITYPSKERLEEALKKFEPGTVDDFLEYQFAQHQLDDHFRAKANAFKNKMKP